MRRAERGGERLFYHALWALLFAAACAWFAAALYARLEAPDAAAPAETAPASPGGGRFRGLLLRREERVDAAAFPAVTSGTRLSAAETGGESALYFIGCDGWEALCPADAERLTPERLAELLAAPAPEPREGARLVYGFTLGCVALFEGEAAPQPGRCRLRIDGAEAEAQLLSVTTDALGRRALLLRLTDFPQALYERRFIEGEILE